MAHEIKQAVVVEFEARLKPKLEAALKQVQNWVSEPIEAALTDLSLIFSMTDEEFEATLQKQKIENKKWLPRPVEDFVVGAVGGGLIGYSMNILEMAVHYVFKYPKPTHATIDLQPLVKSIIAGSGWEIAHNFGVSGGVTACIFYFLENSRYINEHETRVIATFGTVVTMSLMTGLTGEATIYFSLMYAFMSDGLYKMGDKLFKVKAKDVSRDKTRDKFSCIGLGIDHHATNFNTGFFTSNALSLDHRQDQLNATHFDPSTSLNQAQLAFKQVEDQHKDCNDEVIHGSGELQPVVDERNLEEKLNLDDKIDLGLRNVGEKRNLDEKIELGQRSVDENSCFVNTRSVEEEDGGGEKGVIVVDNRKNSNNGGG
ncbi:hypothetical protein QVD17_07755 [Tagetes erecta]|uniref:Uncharacterized protein n=1 Tax=Tagetes erecta TaxID=13708 RepID=A0AAD8P3X4_TARER|nr:hypothetical protein QVD17_07755 [Tagetes erecta]